MRKLYFLKQDALEILRSNMGNNLSKYRESTNEWIYDFFDGGDPFVEFKNPAPDFKLIKHRGGNSKLEVENAKILYRNLKDILTPSQASDERFWAGLAHGVFWGYMHERWEMDKSKASLNSIKTRYFFQGTIRHSLRAHTISRLWWVAHQTYDEKREDPFELLDAFKHDFVTKVYTFLSSGISNSPRINRALASAIIELEKIEEGRDRDVFRALLRYLNILGGINIIDCYEEEELTEILVEKGLEIIDEREKELSEKAMVLSI